MDDPISISFRISGDPSSYFRIIVSSTKVNKSSFRIDSFRRKPPRVKIGCFSLLSKSAKLVSFYYGIRCIRDKFMRVTKNIMDREIDLMVDL